MYSLSEGSIKTLKNTIKQFEFTKDEKLIYKLNQSIKNSNLILQIKNFNYLMNTKERLFRIENNIIKDFIDILECSLFDGSNIIDMFILDENAPFDFDFEIENFIQIKSISITKQKIEKKFIYKLIIIDYKCLGQSFDIKKINSLQKNETNVGEAENICIDYKNERVTFILNIGFINAKINLFGIWALTFAKNYKIGDSIYIDNFKNNTSSKFKIYFHSNETIRYWHLLFC